MVASVYHLHGTNTLFNTVTLKGCILGALEKIIIENMNKLNKIFNQTAQTFKDRIIKTQKPQRVPPTLHYNHQVGVNQEIRVYF